MLISDIILQQLTAKVSKGANLWVAYSGGMDSTALLHALTNTALANKVKALHVNHQLSANASAWQQHCQRYCLALGVGFYTASVELNKKHGGDLSKGLEAAAREARYQVFNAHAQAGDVILMGHHLNDQAETFLYRAMRGAGLQGLCAMPEQRELLPSRALIYRPMLNKTRTEIEHYAKSQGLQWIEDESNTEHRFDRNFIRHRILPHLLARWPQALSALSRATDNLRADQALLDMYLAEDIQACDCRDERLGQSIALHDFFAWSSERQNALIRYWVRSNGYLPPQQVHLQQLSKQLQPHADGLAKLCIGWGGDKGCELRWFNQRLYLIPRISKPILKQADWLGTTPYDCGDGFVLQLANTRLLSADHSAKGFADGQLTGSIKQIAHAEQPESQTVCFRIGLRQPSLRMQVRGRDRGQSVKKLLQEAKLEPWLRQRVPFIFDGDTLLAIGDIYLAKDPRADRLEGLGWVFSANRASSG